MSATKKPAKSTSKTATKYEGFTDDERDAMKQRAKELKSETRRGAQADTESETLAKIAEMQDSDRVMAERVHAVITASAPTLTPKLWYGMPSYANKDGKIVCFFQAAAKFKSRYATFGFDVAAKLDEGTMWPTAFALTALTPADEARITALVKKAAS